MTERYINASSSSPCSAHTSSQTFLASAGTRTFSGRRYRMDTSVRTGPSGSSGSPPVWPLRAQS
ncbi:MAG: hypothetical protein ACXQTE_06165 [Methanosarcinaceae archaeon]